MKKNCLIILSLFFFVPARSIDWGTVKPLIDTMLAHYERNQNYHAVITDEWIRKDQTSEPIGDTLKVYKYNDLGYLNTGDQLNVFTEDYDIYINTEDHVMNVRKVTPEEIQNINQISPTQDMILKLMGTCDSARLVDSSNGSYTLEFYSNNPLIYKSKFIIDGNNWIREIWRYYTNNDKYESQHTLFHVMEPLNNGDIDEFDQDNYIHVHNEEVTPDGIFENYTLNLLRE